MRLVTGREGHPTDGSKMVTNLRAHFGTLPPAVLQRQCWTCCIFKLPWQQDNLRTFTGQSTTQATSFALSGMYQQPCEACDWQGGPPNGWEQDGKEPTCKFWHIASSCLATAVLDLLYFQSAMATTQLEDIHRPKHNPRHDISTLLYRRKLCLNKS